MSKHTPGPWNFHKYPDVQSHTVWSKDRDSICSVRCKDGNLGEQLENARLIAAAPELLEALKSVLANSQKSNGSVLSLDAANTIFEAIAKAEGGDK